MATVFYNNKRSSYFSRSKLTLGDIEDESKDSSSTPRTGLSYRLRLKLRALINLLNTDIWCHLNWQYDTGATGYMCLP